MAGKFTSEWPVASGPLLERVRPSAMLPAQLATRNSQPYEKRPVRSHVRTTGHWPPPHPVALDRTPNILYSHPPMNSALRRYAYFYGYYS